MYSPSLYITTCHATRERRCLRHSGAQQSHLPAEFLSNRRPRHRGMAASSPLHRDASASRPSQAPIVCTASLHACLHACRTPEDMFSGLGCAQRVCTFVSHRLSLPFASHHSILQLCCPIKYHFNTLYFLAGYSTFLILGNGYIVTPAPPGAVLRLRRAHKPITSVSIITYIFFLRKTESCHANGPE